MIVELSNSRACSPHDNLYLKSHVLWRNAGHRRVSAFRRLFPATSLLERLDDAPNVADPQTVCSSTAERKTAQL